MTSLSEIVEVVIGVDTHVATHSAAVVDARTGGVLGELTVQATPVGYQQLADFAGEHRGPPAVIESLRLPPRLGGTAHGYQAVFASLAIAVPGPHGLTGGRPGALPVRLIVAALA